MTLPYQEKHSLLRTKKFLLSLLDPKKTPRVPKSVRDEAGSCLRHYPYDVYIDMMYEWREQNDQEAIPSSPTNGS